jgi:cytochrome c-type biogenesis protein CcmH
MILIAILLALIVVFVVLWPVLNKGREVLERDDAALAIFKDQLSEVDRDAARGLIAGPDAEAARTEIKRRMLSASRETSQGNQSTGSWLVVLFALLVPLGGAGIYTLTGSPTTPSMPFAERAAEQTDAQELQTLVTRLRTQLEEDPNGGETRGWELLATTYMNMGRFMDASYAFEQITTRPEATSATWSQYAESLIAAERGAVTPKAARAVQEALRLDPSNPAGTFYSALALEQGGNAAMALQLITDRLDQETAFQPWMQAFVAEANRIGATIAAEPIEMPYAPPAGPSREDVEAAQDLTAEEQQEFIAGMVERLAERLKDEPDDLQGWLQLARAYVVLGREEDALVALQTAQPLTVDLAEDNPMRRALEAGLTELGG